MNRIIKSLGVLFSGTDRAAPSAKVYIPFDSRTSVGGPATFLRNLKCYLDQVNFPYASRLNQASVILFPISYDLSLLKRFKKRGGVICQRLDGVYYSEKHGDEHKRRNQKMQQIYQELADYVVFQSDYSRMQCFDMFGPFKEGAYSIIVNGVNADIFYPDTARTFDRGHVHFCTTGSIRNSDMLVPVIQALDLISDRLNFTFHVVGPVKNEQCAQAMQRKYVVHHDKCDLIKVSEILRQSDVFIYSHLNPPCPNSVLEAAATGLPVTGYASGSLPELLSFSRDLLADAGDRIYHRLEDFRPEALADRLLLAVDHYGRYRELSLQASARYSMEKCGAGYVHVLERLTGSLQRAGTA